MRKTPAGVLNENQG